MKKHTNIYSHFNREVTFEGAEHGSRRNAISSHLTVQRGATEMTEAAEAAKAKVMAWDSTKHIVHRNGWSDGLCRYRVERTEQGPLGQPWQENEEAAWIYAADRLPEPQRAGNEMNDGIMTSEVMGITNTCSECRCSYGVHLVKCSHFSCRTCGKTGSSPEHHGGCPVRLHAYHRVEEESTKCGRCGNKLSPQCLPYELCESCEGYTSQPSTLEVQAPPAAIQRYELYNRDVDFVGRDTYMVKDTEGDYVMYDDHVHNLAATRASLDRARELLRNSHIAWGAYPTAYEQREAIEQFLADTEPK